MSEGLGPAKTSGFFASGDEGLTPTGIQIKKRELRMAPELALETRVGARAFLVCYRKAIGAIERVSRVECALVRLPLCL